VITALVLAGLLLLIAYIFYRKEWKYYYFFLIAAFSILLVLGILTSNPLLIKVLFGGAMGMVVALSLIVDHFYKKIKELKKQEVKHE
jgi:hypothetical protein